MPKAANDGLSAHCVLCMREFSKEQPNAPRTEEEKRLDRHKHLVRRFGITLVVYEKLFLAQKGLCAICGGEEKNKTLAVDHDHITGKIRGLLCGSCNPAIGFLKDSPELALRAAEYLKKHKE